VPDKISSMRQAQSVAKSTDGCRSGRAGMAVRAWEAEHDDDGDILRRRVLVRATDDEMAKTRA
jgi:hypothetical protein